MTRLDKIAADITLAQQTIPNGDVTAEPGRSILAARLRLQHEHAPALLDFAREVAEMVTTGPDAYDANYDDVRDALNALEALTETTEGEEK